MVHISVAALQNPSKNSCVFLTKAEDGKTVEFGNIPFSLEKVQILDCQYGQHYFKKREKGNKIMRLQGSRKIGCQAKIRIKCCKIYPDYAVPDTSNMTLRQAKQAVLNKLHKALESDERVTIERKYFVSLPSNDTHRGHSLGCDACGFAQ